MIIKFASDRRINSSQTPAHYYPTPLPVCYGGQCCLLPLQQQLLLSTIYLSKRLCSRQRKGAPHEKHSRRATFMCFRQQKSEQRWCGLRYRTNIFRQSFPTTDIIMLSGSSAAEGGAVRKIYTGLFFLASSPLSLESHRPRLSCMGAKVPS